MQVIDATFGDGGEVEITDGGLNHKFVEVRLKSQIGKGLDYLIMTYTESHTTSNITRY